MHGLGQVRSQRLCAPAGTPRPIVDRMNAEIAKAVRSPDVTQKFVEQFNMEILTSLPAAFAEFQKVEQERWTRIIKENDIKGVRTALTDNALCIAPPITSPLA